MLMLYNYKWVYQLPTHLQAVEFSIYLFIYKSQYAYLTIYLYDCLGTPSVPVLTTQMSGPTTYTLTGRTVSIHKMPMFKLQVRTVNKYYDVR